MAANKVGKRAQNKFLSPSRNREAGLAVQKRQARVTVKYDRKELQKRLDVEKWIDERLEELYLGREKEMPEELNIDDLLDLASDEERSRKLKDMLHSCNSNIEEFTTELLIKLHGLPKQNVLQRNGIEHQEVEKP
ncbi:protein phosphatase 1 regulatory subunit 14A [Latimeria chalumnae]|uniref:Protein phosphatase 1 regulatory subunit 14A n=1 Tax=Latimeria chalumnae TaxID=7897 RepID=H3BAE7_LATCH|nr:PREDICTED: protein phosphatase 1 regulatory subunit 14A [Latimeria chalumnae]|eukprot:XP_005991672.1 PREDICTED: protein phosphatase 1 regulatory subunit 14A [Latimeria chalumnae]